MKRSTIITSAGVLGAAALVFLFFGLGPWYGPCAHLEKEPVNVSLAKNAVRKYRASGDWDAAIICEVERSKKLLMDYKPAAGEKPAVVFDVDDTALSNWKFIDISDFGYHHGRYKVWENSARDSAIKPVQELYVLAREKGFAIFFITGRREVQRDPMERNLRDVGFAEWEGVFLKPMDYHGGHAKDFKSKWRAHIEGMGYKIVLNIGDQQSDLDGNPHAVYDIKIANPAYFIP
jgi:predicted secreted acid phosphatase